MRMNLLSFLRKKVMRYEQILRFAHVEQMKKKSSSRVFNFLDIVCLKYTNNALLNLFMNEFDRKRKKARGN